MYLTNIQDTNFLCLQLQEIMNKKTCTLTDFYLYSNSLVQRQAGLALWALFQRTAYRRVAEEETSGGQSDQPSCT